MSTLILIDYFGEVMARCSVVNSRWQIRIKPNLILAQSAHCGLVCAVGSRLFPFRSLAPFLTFQ